MKFVFLGLSITSSWGNGHATTYRGLVAELAKRGHRIVFLERDQPWYAGNRDMPEPSFCETRVYRSVSELQEHADDVAEADCVVIGSYVPDGTEVIDWVMRTSNGVIVFYDIDTPVTLARLRSDECEYLRRDQVPLFDLYLSFTGGPTLRLIEKTFRAPMARALYCSVDPALYLPERVEPKWDLGYLGTYSADRQPKLDQLLLAPAAASPDKQFIVAGPMYPETIRWPHNVERIIHIEPKLHRGFYNAQRFTLNITRADMVRAGYSPSVRLFEAAACGTPIITDQWPGLEEFFTPEREILVARNGHDVLRILRELSVEEARAIAQRARERVLAEHTAAHRAASLEEFARSLATRPESRKLEGVTS